MALGARNIELKARLADLARAREIALQVATDRLPPEQQVDTYFHCPRGRLKLREIIDQRAELIAYIRPDQAGAKQSDYHVVPVHDPAAMKALLSAALGQRGEVSKRREIYLHHNVRIHLDDVAGLGSFLEFEAVLGAGISEQQGCAQIESLSRQFAIAPADRVSGSYSDMLGM